MSVASRELRHGFGLWGVGAMARLTIRSIVRGKRIRVALAASLAVALLPALIGWAVPDADAAATLRQGLDWGGFRLLAFVLPLLFASGLVAEEVEMRTLPFLTTRALGRTAVGLGKFFASAMFALATLALTVLVMHALCLVAHPETLAEEAGATFRALGGLLLQTLAYCAWAFFWGTALPRAARMAFLLHMVVVEWVLHAAPGVLRFVSVHHWARELGGMPRLGADLWIPHVEPGVGAAVIALQALFALGLALLLLRFLTPHDSSG